MKKNIVFATALFAILFLFTGFISAEKISLLQAIHVADAQAQKLLPECQLVASEPYLDFNNEIVAYSLDYVTKDANAINLLLASDQSRNPVIRYSFGRNPDKIKMEAYKLQAGQCIDEPRYQHSYFFGVGSSWHLFSGHEDSVYICTNPAFSPKTTKQFREYQHQLQQQFKTPLAKAADQSKVSDQWKQLQEGQLLQMRSWHYIPEHLNIPDFDWHYGCTPTAAANVLAYYEFVYGYGNMISYYFSENDAIQTGTDPTVPNISTRLANYMGTNANGSTVDANMGLHIAQVGELQDPSYNASDYGLNVSTPWSRLSSEIDDGYPCVLSCDMPGADIVWHSMTAVGYNDNPMQVAVYDINHDGITNYDWNTLVLPNVGWVHFPLVNRANGIELTSLSGTNGSTVASDILHTGENYEITWTCDRPGDGKVDIQLNMNSGVGSWETLVSLAGNPGQWVWFPSQDHVGTQNRIRLVWYNSDGGRLGYSASYSDFVVNEEDLYNLPNGAVIETYWPEGLRYSYSGNQWVVMAIHQSEITDNNTLRLYPDTTFQTMVAEDHVGYNHNTKWGLCGVNVGPQNPPPGPFGIQVVGDGYGLIQFMESEELQWGTNVNYEYWSNKQIVKAYHFYVDPDNKVLTRNTEIYLENFISADLSMYLFDMNNRFFSIDDALLVADNAIAGGDEQMTLPSGSSGRFLLIIRNKSNTLGNYRISLLNEEQEIQISEIPWNQGDTLFYSGGVMPLPLENQPWSVAGILPLGRAQWELSIARDLAFLDPVISCPWPIPFTNLLVMKGSTGMEEGFYLKASRSGKKGKAHLEVNQVSMEQALHDGLNLARSWPTGKAFHLVPINSSQALIDLKCYVKASDNRKIYCGIVPDKGGKFYSTSMLWGSPNRKVVNGNQVVKKGVVVLWTPEVSEEAFSYTFETSLHTDVKEAEKEQKQSLVAYPNPFNHHINIEYYLPQATGVSLSIYDVNGKIVRTLEKAVGKTGYNRTVWNGIDDNSSTVPDGIYIIRMDYSAFSETYKLMLLR
jgi:hypothetical protein